MNCGNCKHWFCNPRIEFADGVICGKCLVSDTHTLDNNVCNAWELSNVAAVETEHRWVLVSERLPKKSGWYFVGLSAYWGNCPTDVVYFDAENIEPRWNNSTSDKIYCWLDGVPVLPTMPEVQE